MVKSASNPHAGNMPAMKRRIQLMSNRHNKLISSRLRSWGAIRPTNMYTSLNMPSHISLLLHRMPLFSRRLTAHNSPVLLSSQILTQGPRNSRFTKPKSILSPRLPGKHNVTAAASSMKTNINNLSRRCPKTLSLSPMRTRLRPKYAALMRTLSMCLMSQHAVRLSVASEKATARWS